MKCIAVHRYGDTKDKMGTMNEPFTHMTVERTDNKERRAFSLILAKPDDVFTMDWNQLHYQ